MLENPEIERVPVRPLKPLRGMALSIVLVLLAGLALAGGVAVWYAICPCLPPIMRVLLVVLGAALLALPVRTGFVTIRRVVKSGRLLPSDEERMANRIRWGNPKSTGRLNWWLFAFWSVLGVDWGCIAVARFSDAIRHLNGSDWSVLHLAAPLFWVALASLNLRTSYRDLRKSA